MNAPKEKGLQQHDVKISMPVGVHKVQINSDTSKNNRNKILTSDNVKDLNLYQDHKNITPIQTYGKSLCQTNNNIEVAEHSIDIKPIIPIENGTQAPKDNATMDSGISPAKMSALCKLIKHHRLRIIILILAACFLFNFRK